jgi:hypothetical protein
MADTIQQEEYEESAEESTKIQKDCEACGDLFEPVGYEGILNAYCGTCEKALPEGTEGFDENGVPYVWSSLTEEWVPMGVLCNVCGDTTNDDERITAENWEYCEGLQTQFCGACREERKEPPCDEPTCDADVCYEKRCG